MRSGYHYHSRSAVALEAFQVRCAVAITITVALAQVEFPNGVGRASQIEQYFAVWIDAVVVNVIVARTARLATRDRCFVVTLKAFQACLAVGITITVAFALI